jgi:tellurite resistance protein TehA-like permease
VFTYIFFFLNLALFVVFNMLSIARYMLFPQSWSLTIYHPVQSLYLGCYPMGATTLINIAVGLIYQEDDFGGTSFLYFLWATWWLDVALSFLCAFALVHIM